MAVKNDIKLIKLGQKERRERNKKMVIIPNKIYRPVHLQLLDWYTAHMVTKYPDMDAVYLRIGIEQSLENHEISFDDIRCMKFRREGGLV